MPALTWMRFHLAGMSDSDHEHHPRNTPKIVSNCHPETASTYDDSVFGALAHHVHPSPSPPPSLPLNTTYFPPPSPPGPVPERFGGFGPIQKVSLVRTHNHFISFQHNLNVASTLRLNRGIMTFCAPLLHASPAKKCWDTRYLVQKVNGGLGMGSSLPWLLRGSFFCWLGDGALDVERWRDGVTRGCSCGSGWEEGARRKKLSKEHVLGS